MHRDQLERTPRANLGPLLKYPNKDKYRLSGTTQWKHAIHHQEVSEQECQFSRIDMVKYRRLSDLTEIQSQGFGLLTLLPEVSLFRFPVASAALALEHITLICIFAFFSGCSHVSSLF